MKKIMKLFLALMMVLTMTVSVSAETEGEAIRFYGDTRYETSYKVADALKYQIGVSKFDTVIVSDGENFADALAGSYLAAQTNAPILMYSKKTVKGLQDYIKENLKEGGTIYILGGIKAVGNDAVKGLTGYQVKRLAGEDRYETNLKILEEAGITGKDVLVCKGTDFADSLSASATGQPILLVGKSLTKAQKEFLSEVEGKIYVLGGKKAVSETIENELKNYGDVKRIGGATRYETSVMIAEEFFEEPYAMVMAYAKNFPDGLCGGSLAYQMGAPMILTDSKNQKNDDAAIEYAQRNNIYGSIILGGPSLISDKTVSDTVNAVPEVNPEWIYDEIPVYDHRVAIMLPHIGDNGYLDIAAHAADLLSGIGIEATVITMGDNPDDWEPAHRQAIEAGYDVIVSGNWQYEGAMLAVAAEYPDIQFLNFDYSDAQANSLPNVYALTYANHELAYLMGVVAGTKTKTNVVGIVAGQDNNGINQFAAGFIQGAADANPDVSVLVTYVGSYNDPATAKDRAQFMRDNHADIFWHVAGGSGNGVFEAVAEFREIDENVWALGVDCDQRAMMESNQRLADAILTSGMKNMDIAIADAVLNMIIDNAPMGTQTTVGTAEWAVGIAENEYYYENMTSEELEKVQELADKLVIGETVVVDELATPGVFAELYEEYSLKPSLNITYVQEKNGDVVLTFPEGKASEVKDIFYSGALTAGYFEESSYSVSGNTITIPYSIILEKKIQVNSDITVYVSVKRHEETRLHFVLEKGYEKKIDASLSVVDEHIVIEFADQESRDNAFTIRINGFQYMVREVGEVEGLKVTFNDEVMSGLSGEVEIGILPYGAYGPAWTGTVTITNE